MAANIGFDAVQQAIPAAKAAPPRPAARAGDMAKTLRASAMLIALALIWAGFAYATDGAFLQSRNLSNLLRQMSVTGLLAIGILPVVIAGAIDLSVGSLAALTGALLAMATAQHGVSGSAAFLMTLAAGAVIGGMQGFLVSYQRVPAFIVTLGGMMALRGVAIGATSGNTIPLPEGWINTFGTGYLPASAGWAITAAAVVIGTAVAVRARARRAKLGIASASLPQFLLAVAAGAAVGLGAMALMASYEGLPIPVLTVLILAVAVHFVLTRTVFGRHVYALGGNADAAFLSGIAVKRNLLLVFVGSGLFAGLAGALLTARIGSASPDAGQMLELDAVAACVIGGTSLRGGRGSVWGALIGALVMESLNNGMSMANMDAFWQYVVKGMVLVLAVWMDVAAQRRTSEA